jgi:biotin carboxyl carrier protein
MADYIVTTSEGLNFEIDENHLDSLDLIKNDDGTYHVLYNNKSYNVSIINRDLNQKSLLLAVNDREIELTIKDALDQKLEKLGLVGKKSSGTGEIKSPMPGLVLEINVTEGQKVSKGQTLLILEAMKMENILKADHDITIKKIQVNKGDAVSKNQVLISTE